MEEEYYVREILECFSEDPVLFGCLCRGVNVFPERTDMLLGILINYREMSYEELKDQIYAYGSKINEDHLMARQIFISLIYLLEKLQSKFE